MEKGVPRLGAKPVERGAEAACDTPPVDQRAKKASTSSEW